MVNPLFESSSSDKPALLTISFASDPSASLGAQLTNCDKEDSMDDMFLPGYATIGKLLDGDTIARKCGVKVGDVIVAVNGKGLRRFAPDYKEDEVEDLTPSEVATAVQATTVSSGKGLVLSKKAGENYAAVLQSIKDIKAKADAQDPLVLSLERYTWDAQPHSWRRFLAARDNRVPDAMQMIQAHQQWRETTFPIDLTGKGVQELLKLKAVSEIDVGSADAPPTVYVNYGKLQSLQGSVTPEDVVKAFVIFTEIMLSRAADPRQAKTCQFIDLSGVSVTSGFRVDILKQIYGVFEPNYPETLYKMVMYPVSTVVAATSRTLLSFVNEKTQKKFVITSSLEKVCEELGWNQKEVEECGGVTQFMHKHEKAGDAMILE